MKKAKPQKEEVFFVGVQDPVEIRRNLLELSKDMVQYLQQNERLKTLRDNKMEAYKRMREDVHQIKTLINKLRSVMPKTKLRVELHEEHKVKKTAAPKKPAKKAKAAAPAREKQARLVEASRKQPLTEIEKLESELADIENKLGKL